MIELGLLLARLFDAARVMPQLPGNPEIPLQHETMNATCPA
jgi:hypothetical protein